MQETIGKMVSAAVVALTLLAVIYFRDAARPAQKEPIKWAARGADEQSAQYRAEKLEAPQPRNIPATDVEGSFASCGRGGKSYLVQEEWRNDGDRPIRTLYVNIHVYGKDGSEVHQVLDYPIYAVPQSAPGVVPGEIYRPGPDEGYVIPFGTSSPDGPHKCFMAIIRGAEEAIQPKANPPMVTPVRPGD